MSITVASAYASDQHLRDLASEINREHADGLARLRLAIPHFVRAGELLEEAKRGVPPGEWASWLAENFEGSQRTAQLYVRMARYKLEIPESLPSLSEAQRWLTGRPRSDADGWAGTQTRTGKRSITKRAHRLRQREGQRALEREQRARAARKRGGTIASGYSHIRLALQDFERAIRDERDLDVRRALERVVHALYAAEDCTKYAFGVDHGSLERAA